MLSAFPRSWLLVAVTLLSAPPCVPGVKAQNSASARHEDLGVLFKDWRAFQGPRTIDGAPDYRAAAMAKQHRDLGRYQRRLAAIDTTGWPVTRQVDYHVVRAEMNGLDFDHRVLRPWSRNPAFYTTIFTDQSDQPAREGPVAAGAIELWSYRFPLSADQAADLGQKLRMIPKLLAQAKGNLMGNAKDLWVAGAGAIRSQSNDLKNLANRVAQFPALVAEIHRAQQATDEFHTWLVARMASKTGPSGIGVGNYDWYLKNVQLLPYTWAEEVTIMQRELARARAALALEEEHNRALPLLTPVSSAEEHGRRFNAAVTEYMAFLKDHDIMTVRDYMDPALRGQIGSFAGGSRPLEFFTEVDYRDPVVMRTHSYHWFDLARMAREPHASPIRQVPLLYNIFGSRTEGFATGWEEMSMQAGLFDGKPRSRELIYILLAQRAARALGDLRMHSNEFTLEQAARFASSNTPRGWLRLEGTTVHGEQHLYLQQPAYGTSYVIGKIEAEHLLAERARQMGEGFSLRKFMDEFNAAGLIPISLIRWELTGVSAFFAGPATQ